MMLDLRDVAAALGGEVSGHQVLAPGPGHSAADRSLSIKLKADAPDGFVVNSFAEDDPIRCRDYVRERMGLPPWKPNGNDHAFHTSKPKPRIVHAYDYVDEKGTLLYQNVRLEPKDFRHRRPDGKDGWTYSLGDVRRVLYRFRHFLAFPDATVFLCEGEKDADRVASLGNIATSVALWTDEIARQFSGRDVLILEDNDRAGREKALKAAKRLHGIAKTIRIVRLPGLLVAHDVSDWLNVDPRRADQLTEVCFAAPVWTPDEAAEAAAEEPKTSSPGGAMPPTFSPKPFVWRDPKTIPPRQWLYGKYLIRKHVSADIAPGGVGKTSHSIVEILAMVSGKALLGITPARRLKVWLWNLEDPQEEVEMRTAAAAMHYGLKVEDIDGHLSINHGHETPLVMATNGTKGVVILRPVVDALVAAVGELGIDVIIADPFVSCHQVTENDNNAIDAVVKEWGRVAKLGNCAVRLTHHARKGEQEITAESGRGASALIAAARCVRVFNRMSKEEADKAGIEDERHRSYYRTYIDKQNMAPPAERSNWFHLWSVNLGNGPEGSAGDSVGVTTEWDWPEALSGVTGRDFEKAAAIIRGGSWRESSQANDWVGKAVAQALGLNLNRSVDKAKIKGIVASWIKAGNLLVVERMDTGPSRHVRKWVEVAEDE